MLFAMLYLVSAAGATRFTDNAVLDVAAKAYCQSPATAEDQYGPIADWDVGEITSMRMLFCVDSFVTCSSSCKSFNADLSKWDTGKVTRMDVSGSRPWQLPRPPAARPPTSIHPREPLLYRHAAPSCRGPACTAVDVPRLLVLH